MTGVDGAPDVAIFDMLCGRASAAPAILGEDGSMDFGELLDRVDRAMGLLARRGCRPDETVALAIRDPHLHLITALALLSLGCVHVGLPDYETDESNRLTAAQLGVRLVVAEGMRGWMEGFDLLLLDDAAVAHEPAPASTAQARPAEAAAIYVKTSGSTGAPKIFPLSFARLAGAAARCAAEPLERRVMRTSSVEFDSTRLYRLFALLGGRGTVLAPRDMAEVGALCARLDVSQIHIGAYALASLMRSSRPPSPLPGGCSILTGGSRVPGALRAEIVERLTRDLWISYATSEIGQISLATPDEHEAFPEGVGSPRPETELEIVDAEGLAVARGEIGEIRARRPAAPKNYVGPAQSSAQFRDGWFYPNDLISWPEGGPLIYHGRADDVMLLNGIKVSGAAIEDALTAHPAVREAAAFAVRSRLHGEIPAAAVVLSDAAGDVDAAALLGHCRRTLGVRAARRIVILDAIPRTPTGKPIKRALAEL